jgi:hypothetical protein
MNTRMARVFLGMVAFCCGVGGSQGVWGAEAPAGAGLQPLGDSLGLAPVVQVTGVVVTGDSLMPIPYATVYRARDQRGTIADERGFFSLPTLGGDTLRFTAVGFEPQWFVVPREHFDGRVNLVLPMGRSTVNLDAAVVYPWPTREKFRTEFLSLDLAPDAFSIGEDRLAVLRSQDQLLDVRGDSYSAYTQAMRQAAIQNGYLGQLPPISILNPAAWVQFIDALRNGKFKQ